MVSRGVRAGYTAVRDEAQRRRQCVEDLLVDVPCDGHGWEGPVDGDDAVEFAAAAFLDEVRAVGCGDCEEFGDVGEGLPDFVGAVWLIAERDEWR